MVAFSKSIKNYQQGELHIKPKFFFDLQSPQYGSYAGSSSQETSLQRYTLENGVHVPGLFNLPCLRGFQKNYKILSSVSKDVFHANTFDDCKLSRTHIS